MEALEAVEKLRKELKLEKDAATMAMEMSVEHEIHLRKEKERNDGLEKSLAEKESRNEDLEKSLTEERILNQEIKSQHEIDIQMSVKKALEERDGIAQSDLTKQDEHFNEVKRDMEKEFDQRLSDAVAKKDQEKDDEVRNLTVEFDVK